MKKRIIAVFIAALFVFSLSPIAPKAEDKPIVTIPYNSPAIPADAGETIDLTRFNLGITSSSVAAAAEITWSDGGMAITSFKPASPGVYKLTASYSNGAKNVYVVAKNPSDADYVLYTNDFDDQNAIDDWTKQIQGNTLIKIEDSKLVIDARNYEMLRVMLPEWLGEFGNYRVNALVSSSHEKDTSRWNSIMYRIQNNTYPYYHMCVRKNSSLSNGVEFALRNASNQWEVITTGAHIASQVTGTFYEYQVSIKDNVILESIDGRDIVYNEDKKLYNSGRIGLQANYSIMYIDSVTVSLQLEKPEFTVEKTLIETISEVENIQNSLALVAEITSPSSFGGLEGVSNALIYTNGSDILSPAGDKIGELQNIFELLGDTVIPLFYCPSKAAVDGVLSLYAGKTIIDAAIVSPDETVIKYAKVKNDKIRRIADFRGKYKHKIEDKEIAEIRLSVNGSFAKTALIDTNVLTQESTKKLRELLLTVWAYDDCATAADAAAAITLGVHGIATPNPDKVKIAYSLFEPDALTRTPAVIGHRGNPTYAPENSLSSYRIAYENGSDIVETDVYLTTDNEVVIMHDGTIDRTTDGTGNIESMTLAQLKSYHLWGDNDKYKTQFPDERIPTLRELLEYIQDKDLGVFIEIKSSKPAICKAIADIVEELGVTDKVSVISFSLAQCVQMQRVAPAISCGYLIGSVPQSSSQRLATSSLYSVLSALLINNTTLNPGYGALTKRLNDVANERGVTIWPWTYSTGTAAQFCGAFLWGYGGLTTNDAQYSKNTVKLITTSLKDAFLMKGGTLDFEVTSTTYGRVDKDVTSACGAKIISGEGVISVEDGKITALKNGKAALMLFYRSKLPNNAAYTLYTEVIEINVLSENDFAKITAHDYNSVNKENDLLIGVKLGSTAGELLGRFKNTNLVVTREGILVPAESRITTGCVVESRVGGALKDSLTVSITADISGDGLITPLDYISLRLMILGIGNYSNAQLRAADINGNGYRNVTDYIHLRLALLGVVNLD